MSAWCQRHCQTNVDGPAKCAGLRRSGRQLTPFRECSSAVLLEDIATVEVTVFVEVVVGGEGRPLSGSMRTLTASVRQLWVAESILGGCRPRI
jgi:hypothetical protein